MLIKYLITRSVSLSDHHLINIDGPGRLQIVGEGCCWLSVYAFTNEGCYHVAILDLVKYGLYLRIRWYIIGTLQMHWLLERYLVWVGEDHVENSLERLPGTRQIYSQWHFETIQIQHSLVRETRSWGAWHRKVITPNFNEGRRVQVIWLGHPQQIIQRRSYLSFYKGWTPYIHEGWIWG